MLCTEFIEQIAATVMGITLSIPSCTVLLLSTPHLLFNWVVCQFNLLK